MKGKKEGLSTSVSSLHTQIRQRMEKEKKKKRREKKKKP